MELSVWVRLPVVTQSMKSEDEIIGEIIEAYKPLIHVPKSRPEKQFFLCPVGLVGSGKTTVLKPLSEKLFLVRISGDEIREILKEHGYDYELTWEIGQKLVREFVKQGYSIAHDTDCATLRTQEYLIKLAQEVGAKIIWIHVNPPEEFIIDKLKNFKHTWLFRDASEAIENYMARKPLHENLSMQFTYTFDTSKANLAEQVENGLVAIKNSL